jgi:hypothetical protein
MGEQPPLWYDPRIAMNLHELAEERSLALHAEIARRIQEDPAVLEVARGRVDEWLRRGWPAAVYAADWNDVLRLPLPEIVAFLTSRTERARELRQVTPFAGVVPARQRWAIWREVRASSLGGR